MVQGGPVGADAAAFGRGFASEPDGSEVLCSVCSVRKAHRSGGWSSLGDVEGEHYDCLHRMTEWKKKLTWALMKVICWWLKLFAQ